MRSRPRAKDRKEKKRRVERKANYTRPWLVRQLSLALNIYLCVFGNNHSQSTVVVLT